MDGANTLDGKEVDEVVVAAEVIDVVVGRGGARWPDVLVHEQSATFRDRIEPKLFSNNFVSYP